MTVRIETLRTSSFFWWSVPVAAALTWAVHEFAHFQVGRWLGYEMWVSMNQSGPTRGGYASTNHRMLIAMAGPLATYVQALIAFWVIRSLGKASAYPFLFFAFFMRASAFAIGFAHPNDEARTSLDLGLDVWVLPAIAVGALLALTIVGAAPCSSAGGRT